MPKKNKGKTLKINKQRQEATTRKATETTAANSQKKYEHSRAKTKQKTIVNFTLCVFVAAGGGGGVWQ